METLVRMDFYFDSYAEISLQRLMVSDRSRTDAFAKGIQEVINGGERVIDVGTGTGLLAMLAAKSGAKKVYAIDQAVIAKAAEESVNKNGLTDRVEIVHGDAANFQLVEPVDLIVSEWLGHFAFAETMLDDVITCRDANLKEGGGMLPSNMQLMLAPLDSSLLYDDEGPGFWKANIHGIDFSHLERLEVQQAIGAKTFVPPEDLIASGQALVTLDLATCSIDAPWKSGELEFVVERDGRLDGFAGWFVAQLSPSVTLDTAPSQPLTHWRQTYFAFPPKQVKKGQRLKIRYALSKHPVEERSVQLELTVDERQIVYTIG